MLSWQIITEQTSPSRRWLAPCLYFSIGLLLLWAARGRSFVREDALKIPSYCGWLRQTPVSRLLLSREVGEDGSYCRPLENAFLGTLAKRYGCSDARPYRLAAGLLWILCAASLALPLLLAGAPPPLAWTVAGVVMAHPYNSWYFISPVHACNPLILPAAVGAWIAFDRAEAGGSTPLFGIAAGACVFAGCLARENAILIPLGLVLAALARNGRIRGPGLRVIACAAAAAGAYLALRRWVLLHDPAVHALVLQWRILPRTAHALSRYAWILLAGSYRVNGALVEARWSLLHTALWLGAGGIAIARSASPRRALAWTALLVLCAAEIPAALMANGEIMPVRATASLAAVSAAVGWRIASFSSRKLFTLLLVPGLFWLWRSVEHARASREPDVFLETHSDPPYSWKIEGERAQHWLRRGHPEKALEAARASERLRPSWLTRSLTASIEAAHFSRGPETLARLAALQEAGRAEPAAQIGYVNLGVAFGRNSAWESARECFKIATELAPTWARAWSQWAWVETSLGNWPAAASLAAKAVELNLEDADSWQNLGYARLWLHDFDGAADAYRRTYALDPRRAATRIFWANAEERRGRLQAAWEALASTPDLAADPYAAAYLARLAPKLGRPNPSYDPRVKAELESLLRRI